MCQQQPDRGLLGVVPFFAPPQMSFFNCAGAPRLMVRSLGRAIEFYDRVLGFDPIDDGGSEVRVRRARATLSLCQGERDALTARDGYSPWDLLIWVRDCTSLCKEYCWRGGEPTFFDAFGPISGGEEGLLSSPHIMHIEDPDEYVLRFVQADAPADDSSVEIRRLKSDRPSADNTIGD